MNIVEKIGHIMKIKPIKSYNRMIKLGAPMINDQLDFYKITKQI